MVPYERDFAVSGAAQSMKAAGYSQRSRLSATKDSLEYSCSSAGDSSIADSEGGISAPAHLIGDDSEPITTRSGSGRPKFELCGDLDSPLIASGWIEQLIKSQQTGYAWKTVLATLVTRNPAFTTFYVQKEVVDPSFPGLKELQAVESISLKRSVKDISLTENVVCLKSYSGAEDFTFRCDGAPEDAQRWVQLLKQHKQLAGGKQQQRRSSDSKRRLQQQMQQNSPALQVPTKYETTTPVKNSPKRVNIPSVLTSPWSGIDHSGAIHNNNNIPSRALQQISDSSSNIPDKSNAPERFMIPTVFTATSGTNNITVDQIATRQLIETTLASKNNEDILLGTLTIRKGGLTQDEAKAWRKLAKKSASSLANLRAGGMKKTTAAGNNNGLTNQSWHTNDSMVSEDYASKRRWLDSRREAQKPARREAPKPTRRENPSTNSGRSGQQLNSSVGAAAESQRQLRSSRSRRKIRPATQSDDRSVGATVDEAFASEKRKRAAEILRQEALEEEAEKQQIEKEASRKTAEKRLSDAVSRYVSKTMDNNRRRHSDPEVESWYHPSSSHGGSSTSHTKKSANSSLTSSMSMMSMSRSRKAGKRPTLNRRWSESKFADR